MEECRALESKLFLLESDKIMSLELMLVDGYLQHKITYSCINTSQQFTADAILKTRIVCCA